MAELKMKRVGNVPVVMEVAVKPAFEGDTTWNREETKIEVTRAGWGSENFSAGDSFEIPATEEMWFLSQYGLRTSGPTQPLYIKKVAQQPVAAPVAPEPESAPAAAPVRRGRPPRS